MKATGLIVEYNPFHNGHLYHIEQAKQKSNGDCMIACMSGNFLQRGEPALIDKFHRAKMAVDQGVDLVVELPYAYAVQHSDLFSIGAVKILSALMIDTLIFGSEEGRIEPFYSSFRTYLNHADTFNQHIKTELAQGVSFPKANQKAFESIGVNNNNQLDLSRPNNILGFSYVKAVHAIDPFIQVDTIARKQSDYHDKHLSFPIASATSIRENIINEQDLRVPSQLALPVKTHQYLHAYKKKAGIWHTWEPYFPFLRFRVLSETPKRLAAIHGVDEGLEHRLIKTAKRAVNFADWMEQLISKRYTYTRLQRMFVHLLTNTTKEQIARIHKEKSVSGIRILAMTKNGQRYLSKIKKQCPPLYTQLKNDLPDLLKLDEDTSNLYYLPLTIEAQKAFRKQEFQAPYINEQKEAGTKQNSFTQNTNNPLM